MDPKFSPGFPGGTSGKELHANAGDLKRLRFIPGSGKSPGGGRGNPLQYSCLETPMDRGDWWAAVLGVAKSQARLNDCTTKLSLKNFVVVLKVSTC